MFLAGIQFFRLDSGYKIAGMTFSRVNGTAVILYDCSMPKESFRYRPDSPVEQPHSGHEFATVGWISIVGGFILSTHPIDKEVYIMSQAKVKEACGKLAESISENPANAKVHYSAEVVWDGAVHCTSRIRHFEPLSVDEPEAFGGGDKAQSPADLVLSSFGACQGIMYAALASAMDIELTSIKFKLKGELDLRGLFGIENNEGIPAGFQSISYEAIIDSPATEEALKNLVNAVERQCPLLDTLVRPIEVSGSATLNGKSGYIGNSEAA